MERDLCTARLVQCEGRAAATRVRCRWFLRHQEMLFSLKTSPAPPQDGWRLARAFSPRPLQRFCKGRTEAGTLLSHRLGREMSCALKPSIYLCKGRTRAGHCAPK